MPVKVSKAFWNIQPSQMISLGKKKKNHRQAPEGTNPFPQPSSPRKLLRKKRKMERPSWRYSYPTPHWQSVRTADCWSILHASSPGLPEDFTESLPFWLKITWKSADLSGHNSPGLWCTQYWNQTHSRVWYFPRKNRGRRSNYFWTT